MKIKALILLIVVSNLVHAQSRQLEFAFGPSKHGSNDMDGISYRFDYSKYFMKKLSWQIGFLGDSYYGVSPFFYETQWGTSDGSFRYATTGLQIGGDFRYSILKTDVHEMLLSAGGFLRYQLDTYSSSEILDPARTGLTYPILKLYSKSPLRTIALGASPKFGYNYTIKKKVGVGFIGGFQFDTNGDTILQFLFTLSRRF